jgi:hypothetical protein
MNEILYEVTTELIDPEIVSAWSSWIVREHIADVMNAGASSGRLFRIDTDDGTPKFSVQYEFATRAALDAYLRDHAPRLRDEGMRRFSPEKVRYSRRVGQLVIVDRT